MGFCVFFPSPHTHSHIERTTQYENPVTEAKRIHAGAQLPNRQGPSPHMPNERGPPPMRAPLPTLQSTAAMEKQLEAGAAARWPEAGLEQPDTGYPYAVPVEQEPDLESELQGDTITVASSRPPLGLASPSSEAIVRGNSCKSIASSAAAWLIATVDSRLETCWCTSTGSQFSPTLTRKSWNCFRVSPSIQTYRSRCDEGTHSIPTSLLSSTGIQLAPPTSSRCPQYPSRRSWWSAL